jgi:hypothetical protein
MDPGTLFGFTGFVISFVAYFQTARSADAAAASAHHADRSATSAEDSASSARRANDLEQHKDRLTIYKALQKFHMMIAIKGIEFPEDDVWPFGDAANLSEFYYPQKDYLALDAIYCSAMATKEKYFLWLAHKEARDTDGARQALIVANEHLAELRSMCKAADEALRVRLRLESKSETESTTLPQ